MDDLDAFLEEQSQGQLDSSGAFTLDWTRARQAYQGLAQADPSAFLLKLLQAAFASRPSSVTLHATVPTLELVWEGGGELTPVQISALESYLLTGQALGKAETTRAFKHLARAFLLVAGRDDLCIDFQAPAGRLIVGPSGLRKGPAQSGRSSTSIRIAAVAGGERLAKSSPFGLDLRSPLVSRAWPELGKVQGKLGCHSSPLFINGRQWPLDGRNRPSSKLGTRVFLAASPANCGLGFGLDLRADDCQFHDPDGTLCQAIPLTHVQGTMLASSCFLDFGFSWGNEEKAFWDTLQLVADGIPVFESYNWLGGAKVGVSMVMDASELPVDASTLALVKGPELSARIRRARELTATYFRQTAARMPKRSALSGWLLASTLEKEIVPALARLSAAEISL